MKRNSWSLVCILVITVFCSAQLFAAATAASGYAVSDFATGFGFGAGGVGPVGLAFDPSGNLLVGDHFTGFLYKFGHAGGVASAATQVNAVAIGGAISGLSFGKDGRLYLARQIPADGGDVVEINPADGTIIRTVALITHATGLATDPISGDLFVSTAGGPANIYRVSNFASGPGTVTIYAPFGADGLAFGRDGTLYAAHGGVLALQGTNASNPGAQIFLVPVPNIDGMAVSADLSTPFAFANRVDGIITKVDLSTSPATLTNIVTGGTRGDFATVGFDGCLYATQTDRVLKVTNADGTCVPPPLGPLFPPSTRQVAVDIKPHGCPNPINVGAAGVLPVAILGTASFDVTTIDPASVKLEGVPALRSALEDTATPSTGTITNATDCTTAGPDGFTDLVLHFDNLAIATAMGSVNDGDVLLLTLTGNLFPQFGGTAIRGQDVVVVINKK